MFSFVVVLVCGTTFFKPDVSNQPCAKCGVNSLA